MCITCALRHSCIHAHLALVRPIVNVLGGAKGVARQFPCVFAHIAHDACSHRRRQHEGCLLCAIRNGGQCTRGLDASHDNTASTARCAAYDELVSVQERPVLLARERAMSGNSAIGLGSRVTAGNAQIAAVHTYICVGAYDRDSVKSGARRYASRASLRSIESGRDARVLRMSLNNPPVRIIREIRRRTCVVGAPDRKSALMLVASARTGTIGRCSPDRSTV